MKISSHDHILRMVMNLTLITGESSKHINHAMNFITKYTVTHINHFIHPTQPYLIKEIRQSTHLASNDEHIINHFTRM